MKKLLTVLLIVMLVMSCSITAFATPASNVDAAIAKADDYYFWCYFYDGYFDKGEDPNAEAVYGILSWLEWDAFDEYYVEGNADVPSDVSHKIPAAAYEALVAKHFVLTDTLVAELRDDDRRYSDGYYYYYIGGWGDVIPDYVYQGYKDLGNGEFELYAYEAFVLTEDYEEYVPGPNEVEGKDYLFVVDNYVDEVTGEVYSYGYPKRILSTIVATFKVDGENTVMTSYTTEDASSMPSADEFTGTDAPIDKIVIDFDYDVFEPGTSVYCVEVTDADVKAEVEKALEDIAEDFVVFEASAYYNDAVVQPDGVVRITFAVPEGYSENVAVYYIAEDGSTQAVKSVYNADNKTITAELEHFSTYALVDLGVEDTDGPADTDKPAGPTDTDKPAGPTDTDKPAGSTDTNKPADSTDKLPGTADNTNIGLWIATAVLAGGLATVLKRRTN